jgi:hypothetical protein
MNSPFGRFSAAGAASFNNPLQPTLVPRAAELFVRLRRKINYVQGKKGLQ